MHGVAKSQRAPVLSKERKSLLNPARVVAKLILKYRDGPLEGVDSLLSIERSLSVRVELVDLPLSISSISFRHAVYLNGRFAESELPYWRAHAVYHILNDLDERGFYVCRSSLPVIEGELGADRFAQDFLAGDV